MTDILPRENTLEESYDRGFLVPSVLRFKIVENLWAATEFEIEEHNEIDGRYTAMVSFNLYLVSEESGDSEMSANGIITQTESGYCDPSELCPRKICVERYETSCFEEADAEHVIEITNSWIRNKHRQIYNRHISRIPISIIVK